MHCSTHALGPSLSLVLLWDLDATGLSLLDVHLRLSRQRASTPLSGRSELIVLLLA